MERPRASVVKVIFDGKTMKYIDLHLHSTYSDGAYSPREVVRMAAQAGFAAAAVCDHDNVDGTAEAEAAGSECGIEILSGVELSVQWGEYYDIHLLGYGFDPSDPELCRSLEEFRTFRKTRNEQVVERVNRRLRQEKRDPIEFFRVQALAGGTFGRPHIAMALLEKGYVRTNEEAFRQYLVPCNVPKRYFPIKEAIDLVHRAGGIAVLAHPPFIHPERPVLEGLLDAFLPLGLDGVEAWNNGADNEDIDWMITQARRRGLLVTGGTDFHGLEGESLTIGGSRGNLRVPVACMEEIRRALKKLHQRIS